MHRVESIKYLDKIHNLQYGEVFKILKTINVYHNQTFEGLQMYYGGT